MPGSPTAHGCKPPASMAVGAAGLFLSGTACTTGRDPQAFWAWYAVVVIVVCSACSGRFKLH
jgi:hypothetical protein